MVVTRITEQLKNKDRISVYVDGVYKFSLTINQLLESKLKVGTQLEDSDIKDYLRQSDEGKLKMRTFDWLSLRPRSSKELLDYLLRKKLSDEAAKQWLYEFQKKNYQNDTLFTIWWIEQRRKQLKSESYIRQELRTKGISQELIADVLQDSTENDTEVIKQLIAKKRRQLKYQDDQKLLEYLVRNGYRYSSVKEALAE